MNQITNFLFGSAPPQRENLLTYTNRVGLLTWSNKWPTYTLFGVIVAIVAKVAREEGKKVSLAGCMVVLTAMIGVTHVVEYSLFAQPLNKTAVEIIYADQLPVAINIDRKKTV